MKKEREMTDEKDKLDLKAEGGAGDAQVTPPVEDWASAFAALEKPAATAPEGDEGAGDQAGDGAGPEAGEGAGATAASEADGQQAQVDAGADGGLVPPAGDDGGGDEGEAPVDVEAVLESYASQIEEQALNDTVDLFLSKTDDQGRKIIRQSNGKLGATINDPDIYRIDEKTGTATFYNPDTGRPFTGDNPRAQAKAWVDAYNDELREAFNQSAEQRQAQIEQDMAPAIELVKFGPVYDKLDPVRQRLFDALIEGYEVLDANGDHVGYSIDLNKALEQVNRQVAAIQATTIQPPKEPTTPSLDMPASGSQGTGVPGSPKSLAEAMEGIQDAQLSKLKK